MERGKRERERWMDKECLTKKDVLGPCFEWYMLSTEGEGQ